MVGLQNGNIVPISLGKVAGKLKLVPKNCDTIKTARNIGISFGD